MIRMWNEETQTVAENVTMKYCSAHACMTMTLLSLGTEHIRVNIGLWFFTCRDTKKFSSGSFLHFTLYTRPLFSFWLKVTKWQILFRFLETYKWHFRAILTRYKTSDFLWGSDHPESATLSAFPTVHVGYLETDTTFVIGTNMRKWGPVKTHRQVITKWRHLKKYGCYISYCWLYINPSSGRNVPGSDLGQTVGYHDSSLNGLPFSSAPERGLLSTWFSAYVI